MNLSALTRAEASALEEIIQAGLDQLLTRRDVAKQTAAKAIQDGARDAWIAQFEGELADAERLILVARKFLRAAQSTRQTMREIAA